MGRMSNRVNRNGYHIRYQIVWEELFYVWEGDAGSGAVQGAAAENTS